MGIKERIEELNNGLPSTVKLVAVSKTKPESAIEEAYEAGQRIFGENKVQELVQKYESLPKDIKWQFIGHLQTNKVKYIASFVDLLHAVDSMKLLKAVNKAAAKHDRIIDCLLQIYIAKESTKFGMSAEEAEAIIVSEEFAELKHVRVVGLMGMATNTREENVVRNEFSYLKETYDAFKMRHGYCNKHFVELSMGMSHDSHLAIEYGSTLIRVGTKIFGERDYIKK